MSTTPDEVEETEGPVEPKYVRLKDAATFSGISVSTLRRMIQDGRLTGYSPAGRILVRLDELDKLVLVSRCLRQLRGGNW
jgi:excisionase family DNA binding protein